MRGEPLSPSGPGTFRPPTAGELIDIGRRDFLSLTADEAAKLQPVVAKFVEILNRLETLPGVLATPRAGAQGRTVTGRPASRDDPYNVFTTCCDVRGDDVGPLAGRRVGIKDNIDVAGVPTTNASATSPYTPDSDAVVVERILRAGGRIVGKLNMDDYAAGATGETSAFGPPLNPADPRRSAGGSSGGSGAALAAGSVDLALGGDQGGSARIPASFCGVVAIKATHGCVPSQGMTHLDHTIDFVCPMARTVLEAAELLAVVAGADPRDPQWVRDWPPNEQYLRELRQTSDPDRLSVGVVEESVDPRMCEPTVLVNLEKTAEALRRAGLRVERMSIPAWRNGLPVTQTLLCHLAGGMIKADGESYGHLGHIDGQRLASFARKRRVESHLFPAFVKAWLLFERYMRDEYFNVSYVMLQKLRREIRLAISTALERFDVLLTPTTPIVAPLLLQEDADAAALADRILEVIPYNTSPLNLSGHPAIAVPNGTDGNGLPTSVQVVAGVWKEGLAIQVASIIEERSLSTRGGRP